MGARFNVLIKDANSESICNDAGTIKLGKVGNEDYGEFSAWNPARPDRGNILLREGNADQEAIRIGGGILVKDAVYNLKQDIANGNMLIDTLFEFSPIYDEKIDNVVEIEYRVPNEGAARTNYTYIGFGNGIFSGFLDTVEFPNDLTTNFTAVFSPSDASGKPLLTFDIC